MQVPNMKYFEHVKNRDVHLIHFEENIQSQYFDVVIIQLSHLITLNMNHIQNHEISTYRAGGLIPKNVL